MNDFFRLATRFVVIIDGALPGQSVRDSLLNNTQRSVTKEEPSGLSSALSGDIEFIDNITIL